MQIMKQLQTTETTVETLSMELTEMQRSQPLARARERQDTVLAEMQRKHEEEMVDLQGRLQRVISELEEKVKEMKRSITYSSDNWLLRCTGAIYIYDYQSCQTDPHVW